MSMLKESPILRDAPTQFFELLALKFTQVFAMPDEIIFRCGQGCVLQQHCSVLRPLPSGHYRHRHHRDC